MAVTVDDLREEVGTTAEDDALLERCLTVGLEYVTKYIADSIDDEADYPTVPVTDLATLAVAAELFAYNKAPGGVMNQQFASDDGIQSVPIRIGSDPLRPAYGLLRLWVGLHIA